MTTEIQWTDEAWNPVVGCSKISSGCRNCYAAEASRTPRLQQFPQYRAVMGWEIMECREQRVKIFVKQLGRNCWKDGALYPTGSKGADMDRWPRGLRIREFP